MTSHRDARLTLIPALLAAVLIAGTAGSGEAADTRTLNAVKCAVRSSSTPPPVNAIRIIGSQDTSARLLYDRHDLLLVNGGTGRDLHLGQQFFIRRPAAFGFRQQTGPRAVATTGWLRIVAVNETTVRRRSSVDPSRTTTPSRSSPSSMRVAVGDVHPAAAAISPTPSSGTSRRSPRTAGSRSAPRPRCWSGRSPAGRW